MTTAFENPSLSQDDLRALRDGFDTRRTLEPGQRICASPDHLHVVLEGLAGRSKLTRDGRRQLITLHLSGEICDIDRLSCADVDYDANALGTCSVATMPINRLSRMIDAHPGLRTFFWSCTSLDNILLSDRIASLGCRTAYERMAQFFLDLSCRLRARGLVFDGSFRLELSQVEIAAYLGLSLVHTNRTLQALRSTGLIHSRGAVFTIADPAHLQATAGGADERMTRIRQRMIEMAAILRDAAVAPRG